MQNAMQKSDFDDVTKQRLGRLLARTVSKFLEDKANRDEFEKWYFETYGINHVWKKRSERISNVKCLCWNCGKEIMLSDSTTFVNDEIWCSDCANPINGENNNNDTD